VPSVESDTPGHAGADPRIIGAVADSMGTLTPGDGPQLDSTATLLTRAREGDVDAVNQLVTKYLPLLTRWAHGRLPRDSRDLAETQDLVQETLVRAIRRLGSFEARQRGALHSYLRRALMNRIRDEIRRARARPMSNADGDADTIADVSPSPLEALIGSEAVGRYETALERLSADEREAIVSRFELGCTYEEIADALQKPSADAARKAVRRALVRLTEAMTHHDD
jgi:RNA polymerase sigma factor (sigma-70 family)